ncbi:MAG: hypothetical protein II881_08765 [Oscillospiraceae bacterium]|nr:hypothetical protein [Oscillospiraceae bacterium]
MKTIRNIANRIQLAVLNVMTSVRSLAEDKRGEITTDTLGGFIIGIVIVAALVTAVNVALPGFFTTMMNNIVTKLTALLNTALSGSGT